MIEKILSDENIKTAYNRKKYMREHWKEIKQQIRERKYKPRPVLMVEVPKSNGEIRKLEILTVVNRVIEQAIIKLLEYYNNGYV